MSINLSKLGTQIIYSQALKYAVILLLAVKVISLAGVLPLPQNIFFADITKIDLFNLLNATRQNSGLNTLKENPKLDEAALLKAQDMIAKDYFSHKSPSGVSPWFWFGQAGYKYLYAGENLAVGFVNSEDAWQAWLNSPSHKENIVNPHYTEVGTAVVKGFGSENTTLVVQLFGSQPGATSPAPTAPVSTAPKNPAPKPAPKPAPETSPKTAPETAPTQVASAPQTSQPNAVEKVLAESTERSLLLPSDGSGQRGAYFAFLNFIVYRWDTALAYIAYLVMLLIAGCLALAIAMNPGAHNHALVARALVLLAVVFAVSLLTNNAVGQIIPHQVII